MMGQGANGVPVGTSHGTKPTLSPGAEVRYFGIGVEPPINGTEN